MSEKLPEIRVRTKISQEELEKKVGKIITDKDVTFVATNKCKVLKPNGDLLFIYIPKAVPEDILELSYPVLHAIQDVTDNRGLASGAKREKRHGARQARALGVKSSIIGNIDRMGGRFPYCRTTAWTGKHAEEFRSIFPLFEHLASVFEKYVPDRYNIQKRRADATEKDWIIGNTPYTTITVNNTYPTGVHKDVGDLHEGFSNLMCMRRGDYSGGILTFPEFRVGANLQDGDLLLMDAHEWHGNTQMTLHSEDAERISLVLYYRTNMVACGTPEEEIENAKKTVSPDFQPEDPKASDFVTTEFAGRHDPRDGIKIDIKS